MAATFNLFSDAALTTPLDPNISNHNVDGSNDPQDFHFYLGSLTSGRRIRAASNPGTDQMTLSIVQRTALFAITTAYIVGDKVRPISDNDYLYTVTVAGTSGGSEPTWPTVIGNTVVSGGVTFQCTRKRHRPSEVKLALSPGGLAGATPGASLNLGTSLLSLTANKLDIYMRLDDATAAVFTPSPTDLYLQTNLLTEDSP